MGLIDHAKKLHAIVTNRVHPQHVVFHHVPKCGGTSVGRALRKRYLFSQATVRPESSFRAFQAFTGSSDREELLVDVLDFREQMLLYLMFENIRCISAHVRFSTIAYSHFRDIYKFVTILREPVSRFVSHYHWNTRMTEDHGHFDLPFEEFLETGRAARYGAIYVEYFCGLPKDEDIRSRAAIEAAVENLRKFDVIGYLDSLQDFEADLKQALGAGVRIGHENKRHASKATQGFTLTPELRARVEEVCAPDLEVWRRLQKT